MPNFFGRQCCLSESVSMSVSPTKTLRLCLRVSISTSLSTRLYLHISVYTSLSSHLCLHVILGRGLCPPQRYGWSYLKAQKISLVTNAVLYDSKMRYQRLNGDDDRSTNCGAVNEILAFD